MKFLDRLMETWKDHQSLAQKDQKRFEKSQDFISDTFKRLIHVNDLLIKDEPTEQNENNEMFISPTQVNFKFDFYRKNSILALLMINRLYNIHYNKDEQEDKEMNELMKEDVNFGAMSKEINRMLARNHIVNKYNKKFRLTNKARQWNIQF